MVDVVEIIHADKDASPRRHRRETLDHLWCNDFIRDHDVPYSSVDQRLRLAHLLATDPASAALLDLIGGNVRGFMGLGMPPMANPILLYESSHDGNVVLEGVQVHDKTRRVEVLDTHSDGGRQTCRHVRCSA